MYDFPSEESPNEGKKFLWDGPTASTFFFEGKRPVGLPDINRGKDIQQGTPPLSFLSSIHPQTLLFTQPTEFYLSRQSTLARIRGQMQSGGIHPVRKWLFDNYLLQDRLFGGQSIIK